MSLCGSEAASKGSPNRPLIRVAERRLLASRNVGAGAKPFDEAPSGPKIGTALEITQPIVPFASRT